MLWVVAVVVTVVVAVGRWDFHGESLVPTSLTVAIQDEIWFARLALLCFWSLFSLLISLFLSNNISITCAWSVGVCSLRSGSGLACVGW